MYKISVSDILKLPILKDAVVIAGKRGLDNPISYISVFDNYIDENDFANANTRSRNAVYLTSMYHGRDNTDYISFALRYFHRVHSAAVLVTDEYVKEFAEEDIALADSLALPLISISKALPYSLIISKISERLLIYQQMRHSEDILTFLTDKSLPEYKKQDLLNTLNPFFANTILCFFIRGEHLIPNAAESEEAADGFRLIERINRNTLYYGSFYRDGILIVKSFKGNSSVPLKKHVDSILEIVRDNLPDCSIGISNPTPLYMIGEAISQSYTAATALSDNSGSALSFNELGVARLLLNLEGHPALEQFYEETITPILRYDQKYNSHLLETITVFIEHNMDFSKTSKALFVHDNTIRYRMNKIKDMIPYGKNDMDFNQTIYMLYMLKKLKLF